MNFLVKSIKTDNGINYLNAGLMVLSAAIAFFLPFHLFLFAYAVLGPLHYLTDISWLEKRSFFIPNKWDILGYVLLCVLITIGIFNKQIENFTTPFMIISVVFAFLLVFMKNRLLKIVLGLIIFILVASYFRHDKLSENQTYRIFILFGILLPTLIHVYVFTGLFMISGALKQKLFSGFVSLIVFVCCTAFFFLYIPDTQYTVTEELQKVFDKFKWMNRGMMYVFGIGGFNDVKDVFTVSDTAVYNLPIGIAVMRFIAFAYCYHYLNWFSKTSVIKWHEVSKKRMFVIIALWVLSVALYAVNYDLGFYALFFLSMLHVMCEFPLNIQSFKTIGQEIGKLGSSKTPAKAAAKK